MIAEIQCTERFKENLARLTESKKRTVINKVRSLVENPRSSALNVHRYEGEEDAWECYIDHRMRLIYQRQGGQVCLKDLGYHSILDKASRHSVTDYSHQLSLDIDLQSSSASEEGEQEERDETYPWNNFVAPLQSSNAQLPDTSNFLYFFQNTHLRILGVPAHLIEPLKAAPSLEAALTLSELPERTRLWLEELSTSPGLHDVRFDSSRLLFRTTLDRLEGYCEGKIKQLMLSLQPEQRHYVDLPHTPLILLKGVAGSGKTTVGIYRAIHLAEQGRRVLVLSFNKMLAQVTDSLIKELIGPLPANLEVRTLHSLLARYLDKRLVIPGMKKGEAGPAKYLQEALVSIRSKDNTSVLKRPIRFFEDEIQRVIKGFGLHTLAEYKEVERYGRKTPLSTRQREAVWKVYETYQHRLRQAGYNDWSDAALLTLESLQGEDTFNWCDDVIVDEAQDLTPVDLRVIQHFISSTGSLLILGDAAQTLYSRGFSWKQAGIQARGHTALLRKNHRNTRQIAEASAQLLLQNTIMQSANEYVKPEWTQRQGPLPIVLEVANSATPATNHFRQIEMVCNTILDLVSDQTFRLSDFAIICRSKEFCEQCQTILKRAGLSSMLRTDRDFDVLEEQIKLLTIHSAKGLEFPVVFLMGVVEGELPYNLANMEEEERQLEMERERTLCYVGMTRAADALYLLTVQGQTSRFIHELAGKITTWSAAKKI